MAGGDAVADTGGLDSLPCQNGALDRLALLAVAKDRGALDDLSDSGELVRADKIVDHGAGLKAREHVRCGPRLPPGAPLRSYVDHSYAVKQTTRPLGTLALLACEWRCGIGRR